MNEIVVWCLAFLQSRHSSLTEIAEFGEITEKTELNNDEHFPLVEIFQNAQLYSKIKLHLSFKFRFHTHTLPKSPNSVKLPKRQNYYNDEYFPLVKIFQNAQLYSLASLF